MQRAKLAELRRQHGLFVRSGLDDGREGDGADEQRERGG